MADRKSAAPSTGAAEQAMNRVLAAERDAAQAITSCEAATRDKVHAARQSANRIAARTDERITLMQMRCAKQIAATLQQLAREQQADSEQTGAPLDDAGISACMETLAATLTVADAADDKDSGQ